MFPTNLIILGAILLALVIVAALLKRKFSAAAVTADAECIYELWGTILSPAERSFAGVLDQVLPEGVRLLAKVRLNDVFFTRKDLAPSRRTAARNRLNQKHVDFLLVRANDFTPLAGIELDDRSQARATRQLRDDFVDQVFSGCRLPLLRVPAQATYNVAELQTKIDALLAPAPV